MGVPPAGRGSDVPVGRLLPAGGLVHQEEEQAGPGSQRREEQGSQNVGQGQATEQRLHLLIQ